MYYTNMNIIKFSEKIFEHECYFFVYVIHTFVTKGIIT